jgi:hypothetical protein
MPFKVNRNPLRSLYEMLCPRQSVRFMKCSVPGSPSGSPSLPGSPSPAVRPGTAKTAQKTHPKGCGICFETSEPF